MMINDNFRATGISGLSSPDVVLAKKPPKEKEEKAPVAEDKVSVSGGFRETTYPRVAGNKVEALTSAEMAFNKIEETIKSAKSSVQLQMYRLGHNKIVDLLANQAQKGIKVQVLLDPTPGYNPKDAEEQKQIQDYLKSAGVEILKYPIDKPGGKIDHVKLLVVDKKSVVMGGINWDKHSFMNTDSDVFMEGPVVNQAVSIFQNDWNISGGKNIPGTVNNQPIPGGDTTARMATTEEDRQDIKTVIQDNIKNAKKSIYMEAFSLAEKETIQNLIEAKQRGVDVRVLMDPNKPIFFINNKSAKELKDAGVQVRWLNVDIQKQEKLHAKLAVFDEETTIIGSCNFTKNGMEINHEANVELISKSVGPAFSKMFEDHWNNRGVEKPPSLPDFYETLPEEPPKQQMGKALFRYFTEAFHPDDNRVFTGKKKDAVLSAIEEFDKTPKPAELQILGLSGQKDKIDEAKEMRTIGDLASFAGNIKEMEMNPKPGEHVTIHKRRLELSEKGAEEVHKNIPKYMQDMLNAIETKDIRDFVEQAFAKIPQGFYQAPSSASGRYHPADEVDPRDINPDPGTQYEPYKGGGLVLHARRTQLMAEKLCDHYGVKGREKDEILAAMALHDAMKGVSMEGLKDALKNGTEIPWNKTTTPEHGSVAGEWIKSMDKSPGQKLTKNIQEYVSNHMSIWNKPQSTPPDKIGNFIVSMADYIPSQSEFYLQV